MWQNFNNWSIQMKIWEFYYAILRTSLKVWIFFPQIKDSFPLESGSLSEREKEEF